MANIKTDEDFASAAVFMIYPSKIAAWRVLLPAERLKIIGYLSDAPEEFFDILDDFLDLAKDHELYEAATNRISKATFDEIKKANWLLFMPSQVFDRLLMFWSKSKNFAEANDFGRSVRSSIPILLSPRQYVEAVVKIAKDNDQVRFSNELINVLSALASVGEVGRGYVIAMLESYGLELDGY